MPENLKTTPVYTAFWNFAAERQNIFFKRFHDLQPPYTSDDVLSEYRFTNAYRATDRVSQYLIRNVIYNGINTGEDTIFRILLFKMFNKTETWRSLAEEFGEITINEFSVSRYSNVLEKMMRNSAKIYSSAYITPSGKSSFKSSKKHVNNLRLLEYFKKNEWYKTFAEAESLEKLYNLLLNQPTIGKFLAYQYAIDINYSEVTNFSEMDFIVAGPGALNGISKCFSDTNGYSSSDVIKMITEKQESEFERLDINFKSLWGRNLQLIDVQNLFCEIDKYARVKYPEYKGLDERTRIKRKFTENKEKIAYWFPPKWGLNESVNRKKY